METAKLAVRFTVSACMTAKSVRDFLFHATSTSLPNGNFRRSGGTKSTASWSWPLKCIKLCLYSQRDKTAHWEFYPLALLTTSLRERGHWGDQDVDGRIILRWIFRKLEGVVGTGWSWLWIGTGGGHLWVRWGTFGFHKCGEFLDYRQSLLVSFSRRTLLHGVSK